MLPQRYLIHFPFLLEWHDASGSGTTVSAFSACLSLAPSVGMIVVGRQLQQHIAARIRVWPNLAGEGIWYDFEYTMRAAAVPFGLSSTANTGYLNTG